jgi:hypothetical protein
MTRSREPGGVERGRVSARHWLQDALEARREVEGLSARIQEWCAFDGGSQDGCNRLREKGALFCATHRAEGERLLGEEAKP